VMVLVRHDLAAAQLTPAITVNDVLNVCAVVIGNRRNSVTVVVVYRAPWASHDDTKTLRCQLDNIATHNGERLFVVETSTCRT
jgi:acyl-CoA hydrolase